MFDIADQHFDMLLTRENLRDFLGTKRLVADSLPADFIIDQFYPSNTVNTQTTKIDFEGNYLTVLNSYLPNKLDNIFNYYHLHPNQLVQFGAANQLVIPKVFPILANAVYKIPFKTIYRTLGFASILLIGSTAYGLTYRPEWSTPYLVMLSRDIQPAVAGAFRNTNFRYAFSGTIPLTVFNMSITIRHGANDHVRVSIDLQNVVNPVRIRLIQYTVGGAFFTDVDTWPTLFPYNEIFTLPHRDSMQTELVIDAGGAGETGLFYPTFILNDSAFV